VQSKHYLEAVKAFGTKDPDKVVAWMRANPINDFETRDGNLRVDLYLFHVKSPEETKAPWDYFSELGVIPANEAFRPLDQGGCPLVRQAACCTLKPF